MRTVLDRPHHSRALRRPAPDHQHQEQSGTKPSPCAGGDGQGGTGVGPSAWVTNFPGGSSPIAANGTFTTQIKIAEVNNGLDCSNPSVTCAIISRRDHFASNDRNSDVFIPVSFS